MACMRTSRGSALPFESLLREAQSGELIVGDAQRSSAASRTDFWPFEDLVCA